MTVTQARSRRGEHEISRKTIARGMPGYSGVPVVTTLVCFVSFRTRGRGCIGHPAFPAPSVVKSGETVFARLGPIAPREREVVFGVAVIARSDLSAVAQRAKAEATKQSTLLPAALTMDCFAEPVIGRAFARPVGSSQ